MLGYMFVPFNEFALRPNQFCEDELRDMMLPMPEINKKDEKILRFAVSRSQGNFFYMIRKSPETGEIEMFSTLKKEGQAQARSSLRARPVKGTKLYEIVEMTFDNRKERVDSRGEITLVLEFIGKRAEAILKGGELPAPQDPNRGKFGRFRRFCARLDYPSGGITTSI